MLFEETTCFPCSTVAQAARHGRLDEIERLVAEDHPVDVADNRGWRPIHEAAHGSYIDCLQYLLEIGGTDANWQSFEGITPLHLACEQGNVESVILLLENGADANLHDHMDTYPLFTAVKSNNMEIARQLIGHGARPNVQIYCGTSPLHQAASEGFSDVVLLLLDSGAKLDIREEYDITPIFSAAQYGQVDCLGILLEKAKQTGESDLVDSPADDGATPLYLASQEGHTDCVKMLLEYGADANRGPKQPRALPLHAALQFNHHECVRQLLPHTDKDCLAKCDLSPFYFSTAHRDTTCTEELISSGLSPSYRHANDDEEFKPRILRYFMSTVKYSRRTSPLVVVAMLRHPPDQPRLLLDRGASLNARTPYEVPPLLAAIEYKNLDLVELLVRAGAKVNIYHPKIISNMTVLIARYQWKALDMMLKCGAEADSLFAQKPVRLTALTPTNQQLAEVEDALSDYDEEDYENEVGLLRFPVPFWRNLAEAQVMSGLFSANHMLRRVLHFVGNVQIDPRLEGYIDSKQEWKEICSILSKSLSTTFISFLPFDDSPPDVAKTTIGSARYPEVTFARTRY
ncbi:hypothetical protein LSH36_534g01002 [Paralvinella palmiformis]|uniref:Uncharacterized protein n=1 Tax=Paralvinella palmiformis TaxID=53620 RepID=A0AAD9J7N8_9ANNE|nr:hypothetical protein LSH36_534g01002 [Paralvinella palmiformis]